MKHFRYLRYLIRHKWFVLVAGVRFRAPLWRLLIHDWSKFLPSEWFAYAERFYGDTPPGGTPRRPVDRAFRRAWLRHLHRNPHHWQHWVLRNDDGTTQALMMPEPFVREMVADWAGAGRAISGRWDLQEWWLKNEPKIVLHPETKLAVRRLVFHRKAREDR